MNELNKNYNVDNLMYMKENTRLTVVFYNGETNEKLFEINDRDWMNVSELFTDNIVSDIIFRTINEENLPDNVKVKVEGEYFLYEI